MDIWGMKTTPTHEIALFRTLVRGLGRGRFCTPLPGFISPETGRPCLAFTVVSGGEVGDILDCSGIKWSFLTGDGVRMEDDDDGNVTIWWSNLAPAA